MKQIKILIYVLILLKICYAEDCESLSNCEEFTPVGEGNELQKCLYIEGFGCQLKKCSELDSDTCHYFGFDETNNYRCVSTNNGCELKQCTDLGPNDCHKYYKDMSVCQINENNNGCVLKSCSELKPGKCNEVYSEFGNSQCMVSEDGKSCVVKQCSDYSSDKCNEYVPQNGAKCLPDGEGCSEKTCNDLSPPNCQLADPMNHEAYTCANVGESYCQESVKKCEDLPSQDSSLFPQSIYYSGDKKCVKN